MTGLRMMNELMDPPARQPSSPITLSTPSSPVLDPEVPLGDRRGTARAVPKSVTDIPIPACRIWIAECATSRNLQRAVWSYINPFMLYGRHLGYQGQFRKDLAERDPKALELYNNVEASKRKPLSS